MLRIDKRKVLVTGILVALGLLLFIIPSRFPTIYLSPDETAVGVAAREFGAKANFRLEDKILEIAPWIHPRSWVTHQGALVPVGFLGLPILAGILWRIFGEVGMLFLTPVLVLSAVFPLWRFLKSLGWQAQVSGAVAWLSFPTVILYANRGLFPNLALVCLMLWSAYLVWDKPKRWHWLASGILFGLAGAIRPTEAPWMAIWLAAAWLAGKDAKAKFPSWKNAALFIGGAVIFPIVAVYMAWRTYGTPFMIGYWLRDPVLDAAAGQTGPQSASAAPGWPFGFHPRNVWFNLKGYLFSLLAPWMLVSLAAAVLWLRSKGSRIPVVVGTLTAFILVMVYGQAIYQDHVGHDIVSIGNSFLRYLLPLTPFVAASVACLVALVERSAPASKAKVFAWLFVGCLAAAGIWNALDHDDEALRQAVAELDRYEQIRRTVYETYGRRAIVMSDRSDKIFFPVMRAVSPLPDDRRLQDLVASYPDPVLLFATALDDKRLKEWSDRGFVLDPVLETKNQRLYEVGSVSGWGFSSAAIWNQK